MHHVMRQIYKFSPIIMGLSVSVCVCVCVFVCVPVCVCVSVTIVLTSHILAKIKKFKITFVDFDNCRRMVLMAKIALRDLDLFFFRKFV